VSFAAGIECGHLYAPDRLFHGQCDLACGYCVPTGDVCLNVSCGANGACDGSTGIATCVCESGYVGGSCQYTAAQCNAADGNSEYDASCCLTTANPIHTQAVINDLLTTATNFWDFEQGDTTTCANQLVTHSCAEYFAPGRVSDAPSWYTLHALCLCAPG
jgi:hypothetical protein